MFEKIWRDNLKEIQENKIRFVAVCICFVITIVLFLSDDSGGEEIILTENPAQIEIAENVDAGAKVVAVQNSAVSNENIKIVLGANSDELYIFDPFKVPPKEKPLPPKIESPPVAEVPNIFIPPPLTEKFILRGTVIIGDKKSALIQKGLTEENLIVEIGDSFNGKKVVEIAQNYLIFEDGETLHLDIQTP